MAVEVEATGQVDEFLRVLRRRFWWIIVPFAVIGSLGIFFAVVVPKKYVSEAEIMVRRMPSIGDDAGEDMAAIEGQHATDYITAKVRVKSVLETMGWPDFDLLGNGQKRIYLTNTISDISVDLPALKPGSGQLKVVITYKNTEPERAKGLLDALIKSWKDDVLRRHLQQEETGLAETSNQLDGLNARIDEIRSEESLIYIETGIEKPRTTIMGVEDVRHPAFRALEAVELDIDRLKEDIEAEEGNLELATKRRDSMLIDDPDAVGGSARDEPERVTQLNLLISGLFAELDAGGWRQGHSDYKRCKRDIEDLQASRDRILASEDNSLSLTRELPKNQERLALTRDIEERTRTFKQWERTLAQKQARELELHHKTERITDANEVLEGLRDEKESLKTAVITQRVDLADLEVIVARLRAEEFESFVVLQEPDEPAHPESPDPWIIAIGSLVVGLGIGLALAILLEYSKNCFRSGRELSRVMPHPVLGTINSIRTRRERMRGLVVRAVMGGGTIVFVVGVLYVTWAWNQEAEKHDLLNRSVVDAIDGFERMLK